jgi:membrane protease YdiL (CAAX protease family)
MLILSALAGYALSIEYIWFPILITLGLFIPAYFLEQKQWQAVGTYTALAIISMAFGLAHYHKGSILFVGLAAVAGWAYGYTYLKTKNVFYAALVHSLVNFSEFLFQLKDIK